MYHAQVNHVNGIFHQKQKLYPKKCQNWNGQRVIIQKRMLWLKMIFQQNRKELVNKTCNGELFRKKIYEAVAAETTDSCFTLIMEKRRLRNERATSKENLDKLPISVIAAKTKTTHQNYDSFMETLQVSDDQVQNLKDATKEQAQSELWKEHRKGRLTASNFKRICSRVDTLRKDETANPNALIKSILGYKEIKTTKAMKHGIALEPTAKKVYIKEMKRVHKNFKAFDSGLTLYKEKPYIGASADLETECDCCGAGLCEIKCPEKIKDVKPCEANVQYIKDGTVNKNHQYFYQIQGQMGILGREF